MNLTRTVALGVFGGAVAVWLAAAATTGTRSVAPASLRHPSVPDLPSEDLRSEIAKLHERLRPTAAPLQTRDLFRYQTPHATPFAAPAPAAVTPIPTAPPPVTLKLVGIAEDVGAEGPVRTAMLSLHGELIFAKEGEMVSPQYHVSKISSEVVELIDASAGNVLRLALR